MDNLDGLFKALTILVYVVIGFVSFRLLTEVYYYFTHFSQLI